MTFLLDTHIILHMLMKPEVLSEEVCNLLTNPKKKCVVSAISFWEIALKYALDKLDLKGKLPSDIPEICDELGFEIIGLDGRDAATFNIKSTYHKDPFDRMLIWQALRNKYTLVSLDKDVKKYVSEGLQVIG
jgi:PIN domain nuclease of toxin-antitoxin system